MSRDVADVVVEIGTMDLESLRSEWRRRYGAAPRLRSVPIMRQLLAWRVQAEAHGGLDADTRKALARTGAAAPEGQHLGIGARLTRTWKGRTVEVVVEEAGFRFEDRLFPSLSAAATAIAGSRWNRPRLFRAARLAMSVKTLRCAIYTRKSSDEGLDQSFNSLDAQREAGEAYVRSQAHEGWKLLPARYDDGGFSGGSMERPRLMRLLADVDSGLIDVVVVYKIDRLTRSLADFARIVEAFDRREVSFVSVTQAFNTTSSMGRLTLNVLLSFAQFEREVTGERIRDKIAASKAKGMWMGGVPPLGYDLPVAGSRKLQVNTAEAATVRHIFTRYRELGSVHALQRDLEQIKIASKRYQTQRGKDLGGTAFSRGALFHLLRNRIYLGQIVHREAVHDGEHDAIVEEELFEAVQRSLDANARRHGSRTKQRMVRAPLTGKLFDATGEPMSPTFSRGRSGKSYRYYVSASLQQGGGAASGDAMVRRLSAIDIEKLLEQCIGRWLPVCKEPLAIVETVRLKAGGLLVTLAGDKVASMTVNLIDGETIVRATRQRTIVQLDIALPLRGGRRTVVAGDRWQVRIDPVLVAALRKAHRFVRRDRNGLPLVEEAPRTAYERKLLRLAFLAPEVQRDILAGRQPAALNLEAFLASDVPFAWSDQREVLDWPCI